MRSPTSSEDSRLVRIVVPCAQTRLPGPGIENLEIRKQKFQSVVILL